MNRKASLTLGFAIMSVSAWAVMSAMEWPWKAALFPLVIGIPVFCLAATEVLCVFFASSPRNPGADMQAPVDVPEDVDTRRTLLAIAWILGFFAAIALLSFPIAVPLFVFVYVKFQGREGWGWSLIFTVAVWAAFYALFDRLLHLPFPAGWIQTWAGWT